MEATSELAWPDGADSAISLTFDGGFLEHWELVAPILAESEIRATFFVTVPSLLESPEAWRRVVADGHEIASHSLLGVSDNGDLPAWTLEMVEEDLQMTDKGILEVSGYRVKSFAMSGDRTSCAGGDYADILHRRFAGVRSASPGANKAIDVDLHAVKCSFWHDLVGPIESYLPAKGEWSVPVFERFYDLEFGAAEDDLRVLIGYLKRRKNIWIAPFGDVATHIANARKTIESKA